MPRDDGDDAYAELAREQRERQKAKAEKRRDAVKKKAKLVRIQPPGQRTHEVHRAEMYGYDSRGIIIWSSNAQMIVPKRDVLRLAGLCAGLQKKYVMVNLRRYNKDLKELAQLRKFLEPRKR